VSSTGFLKPTDLRFVKNCDLSEEHILSSKERQQARCTQQR
jgi:hypothetical protein